MTKRVVTVFSNDEFRQLEVFAEKKGVSIYALAKAAIREYLKRHG